MNKPIATLILFLACTNAQAAWTQVAVMPDKSNTVYVNLANIRNSGGGTKMWELVDFKDPQSLSGHQFLSQKARLKYDCQGKRFTVLAIKQYSGNMGAGKVINSEVYTGKHWHNIEPNSMDDATYKIACRIK